jgi:hypothetical protein
VPDFLFHFLMGEEREAFCSRKLVAGKVSNYGSNRKD